MRGEGSTISGEATGIARTRCLEESEIIRFLDGDVEAERRLGIEAHLTACAGCGEVATWAAAELAPGSRRTGRDGRTLVGGLAAGTQVGRFQILGLVGRGGMGEVYSAYHPDLDRRIALKIVDEAGANQSERCRRLLREARAIARLSHPNVVGIHDAGTVQDHVYIAMEFVDGRTLDEWLRVEKPSWRQVLDVFIAAGRGLAAAHAAEIVHRDFKPQNVMLAKDGSVRVMDFGLARLIPEANDDVMDVDVSASHPAPAHGTATTKTGALLGTPAYMAPEQFRGERIDARADQFSFCVALYEALHHRRPRLAHLPVPGAAERWTPARLNDVPSWLEHVVRRGLAAERQRRFPSMEALLAALTGGRGRRARRVSTVAVALGLLAVSVGGWRLVHRSRFRCEVPEDRLAGAWTGRADDPRRLALHRTFIASGRAHAQTTWERVSAILDGHVASWRASYVETCEATHVRGDQSAEALDLRMSCLSKNLDKVQALTDTLASTPSAVAHAVSAARELAGVEHCGDVAMLRTAVALPRDQATMLKVKSLRRSLAEIETLHDVGDFQVAHQRIIALLPEARAVGYRPILGQILEMLGLIQLQLDMRAAGETSLEQAFMLAESSGDSVTAARAASSLIAVGGSLKRERDALRWSALANAILDRIGPSADRIRGWALNNLATLYLLKGDFKEGTALLNRAIALKEGALGPTHPDVALSLVTLSAMLIEDGRLEDALRAANRAQAILVRDGDPASGFLVRAMINGAEILRRLGRMEEARALLDKSQVILSTGEGASFWAASLLMDNLAEIEIATGHSVDAIPLLERSLQMKVSEESDFMIIADTKFPLARALWNVGRDRGRALRLAREARVSYLETSRMVKADEVDRWLRARRS